MYNVTTAVITILLISFNDIPFQYNYFRAVGYNQIQLLDTVVSTKYVKVLYKAKRHKFFHDHYLKSNPRLWLRIKLYVHFRIIFLLKINQK